ncbi:hypothetical protein A4A49_52963, partial [Nicotiana attenuata]
LLHEALAVEKSPASVHVAILTTWPRFLPIRVRVDSSLFLEDIEACSIQLIWVCQCQGPNLTINWPDLSSWDQQWNKGIFDRFRRSLEASLSIFRLFTYWVLC